MTAPRCIPPATLGRRLAAKRGKRSLRDLEVTLGLSKSTLCRIERGRLPDVPTYYKLCRWLARKSA